MYIEKPALYIAAAISGLIIGALVSAPLWLAALTYIQPAAH